MTYITPKQVVLAALVVAFGAGIAACAKPQAPLAPAEPGIVRKG